MEPSPVVQELLAVVGEKDDERVLVEPRRLQLPHEAAELAVPERDVAVVLPDHALLVERLLVVGAGVARGVVHGREGLEHPVEGRGRLVGDVRVHRVDVEERGQALPRAQEGEGRVHHDVGADQLAPLVAFAVQPGEDVESAVELRLGAVDHRVGDGGPGGPAPLVEPLGDRDVRGVERVAQLHGLVLPREPRREDRGHRRLRPGGVHDRRVEDDRVLREGVELGSRRASVAVDAGVVGPKRVHQVDDRERRLAGDGDRGRAPPGALRVARLLVAARLEHQLAPRARLLREVHVHRDPRAVLGTRDRVEEQRPDDLLPAVPEHLRHELDPGSVVEARVDRAGQLQPRALRDVEREAQPAGRPRREAAANDVVQAQAAPRGLEHAPAVRAGGRGLDETVAGAEQVHGLGGAAAAGEDQGEGGERRHGEDRSHHASRPS